LQVEAFPTGFLKESFVTFFRIMHLKTVIENNKMRDVENLTWLPQEIAFGEQPEKPASKLRAGDICPKCRSARMDYDGLLNLTCPNCDYVLGGCFT